MKRSNLILQSAVAFVLGTTAVGSAQAGAIATTFKTYASEIFGAGSDATAITPTAITYQFGVPVAANQTIQIYVQLSGGAKFVAGKVAAGDLVGKDAALGNVIAAAAAISTDSTYAVFTVNTGAAGFNTNSTFTYTPQAGSVNNLATALAASGSSVTATWTNDSGAVALGGVPTGGTNIDAGGTHAGPIAQSAAAITGTILPSDKFTVSAGVAVETAKIDLASTPVGTKFTTSPNTGSTTNVNLGYISFSNVAGLQDDGTGADYTVAKASGIDSVVSGNFTALGAGKIYVGVNDATGATVTKAATLSTDKLTATLTGITKPTASGDKYYVFYQTDGKAAIPVQTPKANASLKKTAASELPDLIADTNLYPLVQNGAQVDVRSFVPASAGGGYGTWLRLINTGGIAAPVQVSKIGQDGTVGTAGTLVASLPVGGSISVSPADVDKALGTPIPGAERPRLRVTAATNGLVVQSLLANPNGTFTELSGAQASQQAPEQFNPQ